MRNENDFVLCAALNVQREERESKRHAGQGEAVRAEPSLGCLGSNAEFGLALVLQRVFWTAAFTLSSCS